MTKDAGTSGVFEKPWTYNSVVYEYDTDADITQMVKDWVSGAMANREQNAAQNKARRASMKDLAEGKGRWVDSALWNCNQSKRRLCFIYSPGNESGAGKL